MSTVVLPGGRATSRVGFGCAALVGGRSRREALDLLERALDAGITHFDVARVYGTGDAEQVVGAFAAAHRDEITIASKFGIDPAGGGSAAAGASKALLRAVTRRSRRALRLARRYGGATVKRGRFTPEHARASLATSLDALATDRLDLFLLHDCTAAEWEQPDLHAALDELRRSGAIDAYGPATHPADVAEILRTTAHRPAVAQLDVDGVADLPTGGPPSLVITHGALRHLLPVVVDAVADPAVARAWSRALDLDAADPDTLASLLLGRALAANPTGIVLVSTGDPARLARHGAAASAPHPAERLAAFDGLLASVVHRPA